jgi:hypothetical protein
VLERWRVKLGVGSTVYTYDPGTSVETEILAAVYRRLMAGKEQYGPFKRTPDGRSMTREAIEECLDTIVYLTKRLIEIEAVESIGNLADAGQAAVEDVPNPPKDGRKVHPVRSKKANGKGNRAGNPKSGGGTGGRRSANRNGGAK